MVQDNTGNDSNTLDISDLSLLKENTDRITALQLRLEKLSYKHKIVSSENLDLVETLLDDVLALLHDTKAEEKPQYVVKTILYNSPESELVALDSEHLSAKLEQKRKTIKELCRQNEELHAVIMKQKSDLDQTQEEFFASVHSPFALSNSDSDLSEFSSIEQTFEAQHERERKCLERVDNVRILKTIAKDLSAQKKILFYQLAQIRSDFAESKQKHKKLKKSLREKARTCERLHILATNQENTLSNLQTKNSKLQSATKSALGSLRRLTDTQFDTVGLITKTAQMRLLVCLVSKKSIFAANNNHRALSAFSAFNRLVLKVSTQQVRTAVETRVGGKFALFGNQLALLTAAAESALRRKGEITARKIAAAKSDLKYNEHKAAKLGQEVQRLLHENEQLRKSTLDLKFLDRVRNLYKRHVGDLYRNQVLSEHRRKQADDYALFEGEELSRIEAPPREEFPPYPVVKQPVGEFTMLRNKMADGIRDLKRLQQENEEFLYNLRNKVVEE